VSNRRSIVGSLVAATLLASTACGCSAIQASTKHIGVHAAPAAQVRITPANGTGNARPDQGVSIVSTNGRLQQVNVAQNGKQVPGDFTPDHTGWKAKWTLMPGASYTVTASAKNSDGKPTNATSTFTTEKSAGDFGISDVTPGIRGEQVGVGMPIIVTFNRAVANRAFVEKALEVKAEDGDEGRWRWMSDTQIVYRTKKYWHPHQTVTFTAHLAGVRALKDVYGSKDYTQTLHIGASNITVANSRTHYMTVNHDGVVKKFPISTGMATTREYTTTSGIHLTKEKSDTVEMKAPGRKEGDPGFYDEIVHLAVRISDRGEYVHRTVGEEQYLGRQNASHGCVRTSQDGAQYFYDIAQRGDVVIVTGTNRELESGNGWTFWNDYKSWSAWVKGSALPA
jgi:lipoprotein-anchoring transpeptidase ErfK/SrfK